MHLTLQRAKLTLQRAFFSKWCVEGSNQARPRVWSSCPLQARAANADWSRVVMKFHLWVRYRWCWWSHESALLSGPWQAYDATCSSCRRLLHFYSWEMTEQLGVLLVAVYLRNPPFPERNWHAFILIFAKLVNVKVVDAIPAKWIQVRKVPARPRPVQEDSFAVFFAGWDSCFLASHERSWQPESLFTTSESEAKEAEKCQGCFGWIHSPKLSCHVSGAVGSELVNFFQALRDCLASLGAVTRAYSIFNVIIAPLGYIIFCYYDKLQDYS